MEIKQAIEKAIEGGWKSNVKWKINGERDRWWVTGGEGSAAVMIYLEKILLDPLFWQALGKTEGWEEERTYCIRGCGCIKGVKERHKPCVWGTVEAQWKHEMHRMVSAIIEGKTIEEFIKSL